MAKRKKTFGTNFFVLEYNFLVSVVEGGGGVARDTEVSKAVGTQHFRTLAELIDTVFKI
jgi:hypothetical protein